MHYPITLTPDDNDTLLVTCPLLPEVTTFGETKADAIGAAKDAILTAFMARFSNRETIPIPDEMFSGDFVILEPLIVLKVELHNAMVEGGLHKADLVRRLQVHPPQVDRILDIFHASCLDQMQEAIAATGRTIEVRVRPG